MCSARGPATQRQPAQCAYLTCHSLPGLRHGHPLELLSVSRVVTLHRVRPRVPRYLGDLSCRGPILRTPPPRPISGCHVCVCVCGGGGGGAGCMCVCVSDRHRHSDRHRDGVPQPPCYYSPARARARVCVCVCVCERERERERERDRERQRETERDRDRQTDRQTDRDRDRQTRDRQTRDRRTDRDSTETDKDWETETEFPDHCASSHPVIYLRNHCATGHPVIPPPPAPPPPPQPLRHPQKPVASCATGWVCVWDRGGQRCRVPAFHEDSSSRCDNKPTAVYSASHGAWPRRTGGNVRSNHARVTLVTFVESQKTATGRPVRWTAGPLCRPHPTPWEAFFFIFFFLSMSGTLPSQENDRDKYV